VIDEEAEEGEDPRWELIRQLVEYKKFKDVAFDLRIREAAAVALAHHERWDGSGYPAGLKGEEIPPEARIVALCDYYDALRSERSYKSGLDHDTAVRTILEGGPDCSPAQFDPEVLQAFRKSADKFDDVFRRHRDDAPPAVF